MSGPPTSAAAGAGAAPTQPETTMAASSSRDAHAAVAVVGVSASTVRGARGSTVMGGIYSRPRRSR